MNSQGRAYREAARQDLLNTNALKDSSALPTHYSYPAGKGYAANRTAEDLEGQNDEHLEGLSAKVKMLKNVTITLYTLYESYH